MVKAVVGAYWASVVAASLGLSCAEVAMGGDTFGQDRRTYVLFDAGRSRCRLVLPDRPEQEEKEAAQLLQKTFEAITGVKAAVVAEGQAAESDLVSIHVGKTSLAVQGRRLPDGLDADGFAIRPVNKKNLVLLGGRSVSTFYAATELLERYAGVLWVWPGKFGTVVPKRSRLAITVRDQVSEPVLRARRFSGMGRVRMNVYRIHQTGREVRSEFHHHVFPVLDPAKHWKDHPDYFGEVDGKRVKPPRSTAGWQACTSNPGVVKLFADAAKAQFRRAPWVKSFSVSPNDNGGFCTCKNCRALDVPGEMGITDRYFTFVNAVADGVAKSHPDKLICCLAYGVETRDAPRRITLRPNTMAYAVIPTLADVHDSIREWAKAAPHLGAYFWMHGKAVPKFYPHRLAKYLQFLLAHHVTEVYAEVYQDNPGKLASFELDGPRVWLTAKLCWDPNQDVDALVRRFCARFYGKGAAPMVRYYRRCEQAWERREDPDDFGLKHRDMEFDLYNADDMDCMEACIEEATRLAQGEPERYRLDVLRRNLAKVGLHVRQVDLGRRLDETQVTDEASADRVLDRVLQARQQADAMAGRGLSLFGAMLAHECEEAIDRRFDAITKRLGQRAQGYWRRRLNTHAPIAGFIHTQLNLIAGNLPNLAANPSVEEPRPKPAKAGPAVARPGLDAAGWRSWVRPGTSAEVRIDPTAAHTGKRSILIAVDAGIATSWAMQTQAAKPGERYRVSCWAKTTPPDGRQRPPFRLNGALSVAWVMNAKGKGVNPPPQVAAELPLGTAEWTRLAVQFTVPPNVGSFVVNLGVLIPAPGDRLWFDDLAIERLHAVGKP